MKLSKDIDLLRSLRVVLGDRDGALDRARQDEARQRQTAEAILARFLAEPKERRETIVLADEVGLGKTFVALAVAATLLDSIRRDAAPASLPRQKPAVLILTPSNDSLFNKWLREVETFRGDCARAPGNLDWIQIIDGSGNLTDLTKALRSAEKARPAIVVAKMNGLGAALSNRDMWRRRALAAVFQHMGVPSADRVPWCRLVLDSGSIQNEPELRDLRKAAELWSGTEAWSANLEEAYVRALRSERFHFPAVLKDAFERRSASELSKQLDRLTRAALVLDWPTLPLVIIDEVHNLKNPATSTRWHVEEYLTASTARLLALSATPFQLRPDELISVLGLRKLTALTTDRATFLDEKIATLQQAMNNARQAGYRFRDAWLALRPADRVPVHLLWERMNTPERDLSSEPLPEARPPRVARALQAVVVVEQGNRALERALRSFVIRHRHARRYRRHWVGKYAAASGSAGEEHFAWAPGFEVPAEGELVHYLFMRAISLAKDLRGTAALGAELTGSYRHLTRTAASWRRFADGRHPLLASYKGLLDKFVGGETADRHHPKIGVTVDRAIRAFNRGQKTVIFCVHVQTAEAIRDELRRRLDDALGRQRDRIFESAESFENFRARFFNRREPLFSLIQDHPLLGPLDDGGVGVPAALRLGKAAREQLAQLLVDRGESAVGTRKPDRRILLAATEHVAVAEWEGTAEGRDWLDQMLGVSPELREAIQSRKWLPNRGALTRAGRHQDPDAAKGSVDPLTVEEGESAEISGGSNIMGSPLEGWVERLQGELGDVVAPYFAPGLVGRRQARSLLPLLPRYHSRELRQLDLETRRVAGQTFRRILMAEEFLIRYLTDAPRSEERWADYLSRRYEEPLQGHRESLHDRVHAYLETIVRARSNSSLLSGYREAGTNLNVVQLVRGGMDRDRYFLGFNTPYRPEILVSTSVGQEGIDLHRECRHVIHHDLCWNPATIEQRTGRVDRIGSKVERERAEAVEGELPALDVAVPYLAATYDERMFEELYRRAQLFEVTMGGDFRVEGRLSESEIANEAGARKDAGIATDEDLGEEGDSGTIELPPSMVERLRVDLSVWK